MMGSEFFQNLLRVMLFGFLCGLVFAILGVMSSYSIPDTQLRSAIFEERVFNCLQANPPSTFEQITPEYLADCITANEEQRKSDIFAFRLKFTDIKTGKEVKLRTDGKDIKYDADIFSLDPAKSKIDLLLPATGGHTKSNYASSITKHIIQDPQTKNIYLVDFEFITSRN